MLQYQQYTKQSIERKMHDIKYWIFDMDGTLTINIHDFVDMRRKLGLPDDMMMLEAIDSLPQNEAKTLSKKLENMEQEYAEMAKPMPGIFEFLQYLNSIDAPIGILTRNTRAVAMHTLEVCELDHFFNREYIIDRHICEPKPSPQGIQYLLEKWNGTAEHAVIVGDYLFDLQAGKNAGISTINIDVDNANKWPQLSDLTIHHFCELLEIYA